MPASNVTLKQYQYHCIDEAATVTEWREEDWGPPTFCKNNNTHTLTTGSIRIASGGIRAPDQTSIKEENTPTGGHFQARTVKVEAPANTTVTVDKSWKIPTSTLAVYFVTTADHEDDELEVLIAPDTKVGYITSNVSASTTVIPVDSGSLAYLDVGFFVQLSTATVSADLGTSTTDDLGEILEIDYDASTITVDTATTNSFTGGAAFIYMTVKMVTDYIIGPPWEYVIGESKIGASHLAKNTIVRVIYKNNSASVAKKTIFKIERLY